MPAAAPPKAQHGLDSQTKRRAADLLSQQIWCWGQDILRPEGNWLIEVGFERTAAPADREQCSSIYTLELPEERRVVLRGFGLFYGADQHGSVFVKRYDFQPQYTSQPRLDRPPWSTDDLPALKAPTEPQRQHTAALTVELIDWAAAYEERVAERLGHAYRQSTLDRWKNNKRPVVPAEEMANAWRSVGLAVAESFRAVIR